MFSTPHKSRWARPRSSASLSDRSSPTCTRSSSPSQLLPGVSAVHLSEPPSNDPRDPSENWTPNVKILSDLSPPEYDRQAQANSLAASKAMTHIPKSILFPTPTPSIPTMSQIERPPHWSSSGRIGHPTDSIVSNQGPSSSVLKSDFVSKWYESPAEYDLTDSRPDAWRHKDIIPRGWQQPRYRPGHRHEEAAARARLQPSASGGISKKDQLGSVNASWGPLGEAGTKIYGMFEIEQDPPSRSTSPFKEVEERPSRSEVRAAKYEAIGLARMGTTWDRRPDTMLRDREVEVEVKPRSVLTPTSPSTRDEDQGEGRRYVESAFGSEPILQTPAHSEQYAQTPMTTTSNYSQDVFGPRKKVIHPVVDHSEGWRVAGNRRYKRSK